MGSLLEAKQVKLPSGKLNSIITACNITNSINPLTVTGEEI